MQSALQAGLLTFKSRPRDLRAARGLPPEEDLPHIWDKFYKVDKAHSRAYGGSGIGLSIVKAIMDAHGMPYGVSSTEEGVDFWFELPSEKT